MFDTTIFWQINLLGVIGTATGVVALIISLINWYRSKSKMVITKLDLIRKNPMQISEWYEHKTREQMRNHILDFELHIILKNKGSGPCSIEKPWLVFLLPSGKKIKIAPHRTYQEPNDKIATTVWNTQPAGQERVWKIDGSQIVDEEIKYVIDDIDDLYEIVDNYSLITYSIEYADNSAKKHSKDVVSVFEEN